MKARRLITAIAMGLLGATSALAASSGEGAMWTELAKARHEAPSPQSTAIAGTAAGGAPEGGIFGQLAVQQQEFNAQRARGVAGRAGADVEMTMAGRNGDTALYPEESIYERLIRAHRQ